jgi:rhamnosyltransferase
MPDQPLVSVVLLTFNGERYLREIMDALAAQRTDFLYEIIVIDSGSSDETLEIVRQHNIRLTEIPNSEFNHGETRNLGARMADGKYVVYITQSATPVNDTWLHHMAAPFSLDERVAAVYGRHIPRPGCDPITKRDIEEFFDMMGPGDEPTIRCIKPGEEGRAEYEANEGIIAFFSDVSSAIRKSVWEKIPYRRIDYAEDQALGRDLLEAGYWKVYQPLAMVYHSHSYPPIRYFQRQFDEYRGLRKSINFKQEGGIFRVVGGAARGGLADSRYIRSQPFSRPAKAKWFANAFAMNFLRRFAGYLAAREERLPRRLVDAISLEARARKQTRSRAGTR